MTSTFSSGGRNIRLESYLPAAASPAAGLPAILLLHGSGGHTGFWLERLRPAINQLRIAAFAVHYFDRTETSFATPAQLADPAYIAAWLDTLHDTLAHLRTLPELDPERTGLLGISLGAFLGLALATQTRRPTSRVRAIAEISGGLVPPFAASAHAALPPTLIVHGETDTLVPVSQAHALDRLLTQLDVPHETLLLPGEGHWFTPPAQARILARLQEFFTQTL